MRGSRLLASLLSATLLAVLVSIVVPAATFAAGALALASAAVAFALVRGPIRFVILALTLVGGAGMIAGALLGEPVDPTRLGSVNQDLVAMLAAVTFVRLVIPADPPAGGGLRGWPAVLRTSLAVHLLGSVINMSAVTLSAHRMSTSGRLALPEALMITRAYSSGAFWSPFWLASAAALASLPGADTSTALLGGAAVAVIALAIGSIDSGLALGPRRAEFRGYALSPRLLAAPFAMVVIVLAGHLLLPATPIPRLVALSAILVAVVGAVLLHRPRELVRQATSGVSSIRAEAGLFVAAGVLTVGLDSVVGASGIIVPLAGYDVLVAWLSMLAMVLCAMLGLHPIVSFAVIATVVLPLDPEPSLFLLATLLGWGAATPVGVTSGVLMHLTSQFGVNLRQVLTRNLVFVGIVAVLAWPALLIVDAVSG